jgi:hypothetical protein
MAEGTARINAAGQQGGTFAAKALNAGGVEYGE